MKVSLELDVEMALNISAELAVNLSRATDKQTKSSNPESWQKHVAEARTAKEAFSAAYQRAVRSAQRSRS